MRYRLHRGGRLRARLGAFFGGDELLGDRIWRRCLHASGAAVLVYYLYPTVFLGLPTVLWIFGALIVIFLIEGMRHVTALELPTIRVVERRRIASYTYYAVALVTVVLLFPRAIAVVAVLGTAFVDPLIGEMMVTPRVRRYYPYLPWILYVAMAIPVLALVGSRSWPEAALFGLVAGTVAVAVEWPKIALLDDDLTMTLVPALVLLALFHFVPG
jgi:hypothetical protein